MCGCERAVIPKVTDILEGVLCNKSDNHSHLSHTFLGPLIVYGDITHNADWLSFVFPSAGLVSVNMTQTREPERRESRLGNCFHQIDLVAYLWDI